MIVAANTAPATTMIQAPSTIIFSSAHLCSAPSIVAPRRATSLHNEKVRGTLPADDMVAAAENWGLRHGPSGSSISDYLTLVLRRKRIHAVQIPMPAASLGRFCCKTH